MNIRAIEPTKLTSASSAASGGCLHLGFDAKSSYVPLQSTKAMLEEDSTQRRQYAQARNSRAASQ
jgi:hypothetical protein